MLVFYSSEDLGHLGPMTGLFHPCSIFYLQLEDLARLREASFLISSGSLQWDMVVVNNPK